MTAMMQLFVVRMDLRERERAFQTSDSQSTFHWRILKIEQNNQNVEYRKV